MPWASDEALGQLAQQALLSPESLNLKTVALDKIAEQAKTVKATLDAPAGLGAGMGQLGQLGGGMKL